MVMVMLIGGLLADDFELSVFNFNYHSAADTSWQFGVNL